MKAFAALATVAFLLASCAPNKTVTLNITNDAGIPLKGVQASAGGTTLDFGTLDPGRTANKGFTVKEDSTVDLQFSMEDRLMQAKANVYLTHGMDGSVSLRIAPDGSISARDELRTGP